MSDRRRSPLTRKLLAHMPKFIRFPLMRDQIRVTPELESKFSFRIARSQEELADAYRILHDCYVDMGYSEKQISGMRIVKYFALPTTTTLIACYDGHVVGTISIIRRGAFGLPMESVFDLTEFIERNEVIAEISSLAIDARFREKRGKLFLPLMKYMWEYVCRYMNLEAMVITVNPSMSDFYEAFLGFKVLPQATVSEYGFANGHPGVGLYMNIRQAPAYMEKTYGHKPSQNNLFEYFFKLKFPHFEFPDRSYYKSSDPVMTPEMLTYFFKTRSTVLDSLSDQERWALSSLYPFSEYERVLPPVPNQKLRISTRYSVKIKAQTAFASDWRLSVLEVSAEGLCVAASAAIDGIIMLRIEVADGRVSEVRGEVRWGDPVRKIYGVRLMKTDHHWADFIRYLEDDFDQLVGGRTAIALKTINS